MEIIYGFLNPERTIIRKMTEQQALQDHYYHKIFKDDNGLIKKIEAYKDQNLWAIEYYIDAGENELQLLDDFYEMVDFVSFFDRKTPIGSFFIERERIYEKNETFLDDHHVRLYDSQDRIVCYSSTDENDNSYIGTVEKYCYVNLTTVDTDGLSNTVLYYLKFEYDDASNQIIGINLNKGYVVEDEGNLLDTLRNIDEVIKIFGNINDYSYYLHPNWMP